MERIVVPSVGISINDENGLDLLDPENPGSYNVYDIELYYLNDGELEEVYENKASLFQDTLGVFRLIVPLNEAGQPSITYIKWNIEDTDTIKAKFHREKNNIQLTDVWFNGELKEGHYFKIQK